MSLTVEVLPAGGPNADSDPVTFADVDHLFFLNGESFGTLERIQPNDAEPGDEVLFVSVEATSAVKVTVR